MKILLCILLCFIVAATAYGNEETDREWFNKHKNDSFSKTLLKEHMTLMDKLSKADSIDEKVAVMLGQDEGEVSQKDLELRRKIVEDLKETIKKEQDKKVNN